MIEFELERLLNNAKTNPKLKSELIDSKKNKNPVRSFCDLAQSKGYNITLGELLASGQNSSDAKLRSVNGGGVDPIDGWDDTYEQFFLTLEWT